MYYYKTNKESLDKLVEDGFHFVLLQESQNGKTYIKWCLLTMAPVDVLAFINISCNITDLYGPHTYTDIIGFDNTFIKYLALNNRAGTRRNCLSKEGLEKLIFSMFSEKYPDYYL